jgi:hypothetical protein
LAKLNPDAKSTRGRLIREMKANDDDRIFIQSEGRTLGCVRVLEINASDCRVAFEFDRAVRITRKEEA